MASSWDTDKPIDHTLNSSWPQEIRNLKDLLKSRLIYQSAEPTTRTGGTAFAANDNGSIWIDSDNDQMYILTDYSVPTWTLAYTDMAEQMVAATHTWAASQTLGDGADLIGSATSDITINTDKFTVAGATGNTSIAGTFESTGIATLADASVTKTTGAPTADAQIANKKYVDDQITDNAKNLGSWSTNPSGYATSVTAATDGFVCAMRTTDGNVLGYTPIATLRQQFSGYFTEDRPHGGIMFPVRKGDTWKVVGSTVVYWIPLS